MSDQNDNHRTGCGCPECGVARLDADGDVFDPELAHLRRQVARIETLLPGIGADECSGLALAEQIRKVLAS
jgi:hypothetical protein